MREALELFSIRKFLKNFDSESLRELEHVVDEMRNFSNIEDRALRARRARELDHNFHLSLCKLADNEYVDLYHRQLSIHLNMAAIHAKSYPELEDKYVDSHAAIVESLKNQSEDAIKYLEAHFDNVWVLLDND
jgi:DNA-binding GntR family transcriptional regulator